MPKTPTRRAFRVVALTCLGATLTSFVLEASLAVTPLLPRRSLLFTLILFLLLLEPFLFERQPLRPTNLRPFELFRRRFCIYLGHIRRQTSANGPLFCILSAHLPHNFGSDSRCPRSRTVLTI
ncbi:hypothetical protein ACJQWK_01554 [Exserohilum turcicum]